MNEMELCWHDERIAMFFDRLNGIRWFESRNGDRWTGAEEAAQVQRVAKAFRFSKGVGLIAKPDVEDVKRWVWAGKREWHEIQWDALNEVARGLKYDLSRDIGYAVDELVSRVLPLDKREDIDVEMRNDAVRTAVGAAFYEINERKRLRNKYPVNPFGELLKFYEQGLWPAGKAGPTFYVFHPHAYGKNRIPVMNDLGERKEN